MSVLYLVVPLALLIVGAAVGAYLWAVRDGQMDDLDTPGLRVIRDEES
jgi:cbb3-type cytochrome oxidase maturation protein